jgi:hypothetical protein
MRIKRVSAERRDRGCYRRAGVFACSGSSFDTTVSGMDGLHDFCGVRCSFLLLLSNGALSMAGAKTFPCRPKQSQINGTHRRLPKWNTILFPHLPSTVAFPILCLLPTSPSKIFSPLLPPSSYRGWQVPFDHHQTATVSYNLPVHPMPGYYTGQTSCASCHPPHRAFLEEPRQKSPSSSRTCGKTRQTTYAPSTSDAPTRKKQSTR